MSFILAFLAKLLMELTFNSYSWYNLWHFHLANATVWKGESWMFCCSLLKKKKKKWRHLLVLKSGTGCKTEPTIRPQHNPALTHTHTRLWMWVCEAGCQQGRLSLSKNTGSVGEETLNCECLPSALGVSVHQPALPSRIVIPNHYSLICVIEPGRAWVNKPRQSQKASLHPQQQ